MVAWAQSTKSRITRVGAACAPLVRDLPAHREFAESVRELQGRVSRLQADVFREWVDATEGEVRSGRLSVDVGAKLIEFDKDGNVVVRFNEAMVTLMRWVT